VQLTVKTTYLGREYELAFSATVPEDLSTFDVQSRIAGVLQREVERFAQITAVALQDKAVADAADADERARKARGEAPAPKGPAMVLAAGTKASDGCVVLEVKE
jgi:hypothetical protein